MGEPAAAGPDDPIRLTAFATRDLAAGSAKVRRMYGDNRLELGRENADFQMRVASATAGPLTSHVLHFGAEGRAWVAPVGSFTTLVAVQGWVTYTRHGKDDAHLPAGSVWRLDHEEPLRGRFDENSTNVTLELPMAALTEVAAEAAGTPGAAVRFLDNVAVGDAAQRYWVGLMHFVHREATAAGSSLGSPLVRAHVVRTLAGAALMTFPNTTMTAGYLPGAGDVGPATLRRAVAHVHAHAAAPLTVTDIAAAAGIGVRALQQAFLRHYGCTPMAYLRRVRLKEVHRELRAADPATGDTVRAIATRWGFHHAGRFTVAYRQEYGTTPGSTLRG